MITGIEHIAIASTDPARLAGWYSLVLGFPIILDTGKTLYLKAPNGVVLEFVIAETEPNKPEIRDAGLRHIALSIDDWNRAHLELEAKGIEFEQEPIVTSGLRLHFFRDPEGNFLHLVERAIPLR